MAEKTKRTVGVQFADIQEQPENIRRPKLLFLAYYFPPASTIGCVRAWNIAKYLARLGWDITVVTPEPSLWRGMENPQWVTAELEREGIRRIPTDHRWRFLAAGSLRCPNRVLGRVLGGVYRRAAPYLGIESEIGWIRVAEQTCSALAARDVDVILATGSPFLSFRLAKRLSDRLGRPYVLDYRDPWTRHPYVSSHPRAKTIHEERKLLSACAAALVVSPAWADAIDRDYGVGLKLHVITNGYDPQEVPDVEPYNFGHFAMVYTGAFYPPKRVITPVMAALKRLKETAVDCNAEWYFHYYGDWEAHVREEAERLGVMDRVVLHGNVPRTVALSAVRGANVSVVITSVLADDAQNMKGQVPAKLFEALGLETSILLIAPTGSDATEMVEETGMGRGFVGTDVNGIVQFLSNMARTEQKRSNCAYRYSWPALAAKLDRILRDVIAVRQKDVNLLANGHSTAICVG